MKAVIPQSKKFAAWKSREYIKDETFNCVWKGVKIMDTEIRVKKGEPIERALRRLKKKLDKEGTLKDLRNRRHYEKPSEIKRREKQRRHR